jgi:hypothetical protein
MEKVQEATISVALWFGDRRRVYDWGNLAGKNHSFACVDV